MRDCCARPNACRRISTCRRSRRIRTSCGRLRPGAAWRCRSILIISASRCGNGSSNKQGLEAARRICAEEDDFGFVRNHLDPELAEELDLFVYKAGADGEITVASRDIHAVREAIVGPGSTSARRAWPRRRDVDGSLTLAHDHASDGRGLDVAARRTRDRLHRARLAAPGHAAHGRRARYGARADGKAAVNRLSGGDVWQRRIIYALLPP